MVFVLVDHKKRGRSCSLFLIGFALFVLTSALLLTTKTNSPMSHLFLDEQLIMWLPLCRGGGAGRGAL